MAGAPLPKDAHSCRAAGARPQQLQHEELALAAVAAVESDVFVSRVGMKSPNILL